MNYFITRLRFHLFQLVVIYLLLHLPVKTSNIEKGNNIEAQSNSHSPIIIRGNNDVQEQNWPGSGTNTDPYLIENLNISSNSRGIDIWDTTVHILIQNCIIISNSSHQSGLGIYVWNSTNIVIEACQIIGMTVGVQIDYSAGIKIENTMIDTVINKVTLAGIRMVSVNSSTISYNLIEGPELYEAISVSYCLNITTVGNRVIHSRSGINYYRTNRSVIAGNILFNNSYGIVLGIQSCYNRVYYNSIIAIINSSAMDDGLNNSWDDRVNRGNGWSDYDMSGTYRISGSAQSVDQYPYLLPSSLDFNSIDSDGDAIPDFWEITNGFNPLDPQVPLYEMLMYNLPLLIGIFVFGAFISGVGIYLSRPYLEEREKKKKIQELEDEARKVVDELKDN